MKYKYFLLAIFITILIFVIKPEYGWLLINGYSAGEHSRNLLAGNARTSPNWTTDLIITIKDRIVTFQEHNSDKVFAYSEKGRPALHNYSWSHIWGYWYVGAPKITT